MNISILGTGWLGFPLAKILQKEHAIKGSVTSQEKMQELRNIGITPYQIKIFTEGVQGDLTSFLANSEILIIDIPPGLRKDPNADFVGKIGRIKDYIEKSGIKKVIFVSSTSIYKDKKYFPEYTEEDKANGTSEAAKQLIASESLLLKNDRFQTSVVRFGGLIGPGRHPVKYLANKTGIRDPKAPVNLIQQKDCIGIIYEIIKKEAWNKIFNAVNPYHPTKEGYYHKVAKRMNLNLPKFNQTEVSRGKKISSVNIKKFLEYEFEEAI
ncbi:nucleoside-diphosphate-sugar epimerase [Salegentibacter sp. 24]|uniref:NAD(P)H-binding protein n=1 Tax=Salegentibacter sp. 24 TaxID=2183986 RepID=UPI0010614883|nr:NAD(P)H-binding protein [Salegentibacter sp. 24]TDN95184.1 nucleoside-diphosphate-sugar epimerase [Salegentibacter sp. 24]